MPGAPQLLDVSGRTVRVWEKGDGAGFPVIVHHGTPSSGLIFARWEDDASERGIRLVGFDRPGYGESAGNPGRSVADVAADVAGLADALGIDRFATWGISGGGPHALACAALLGDRVVAAASVGGVAPFEAEGLNWFAGMGRDNWIEFGATLQGEDALAALLDEQAQGLARAEPAAILEGVGSLVSGPDREAVDEQVAAHLAESMRTGLSAGAAGWVQDDLAFAAPWGFALDAIDVPVLVRHGRHDQFVPPAHAEWLGSRIPGAELRIGDDDGHLTLVAHRIPEVHEWLLERA